MDDKFKAVWVSYSSISDYLKCPRAYYLKNIYKNTKTGRKIEIVKPPLSLGSAVHSVLEPLAKIDPQKRFENNLIDAFDLEFTKYFGSKGGFTTELEFETYRTRGHKMLNNVISNKSILEDTTYIMNKELLDAWLSKEKNIVICGKIDWINKDENTGTLSVIDFKTSKEEEINDLQLQIYALLLHILNKETVNKLYYWYLDINECLSETNLPDVKESYKKVLDIALKIRDARAVGTFICPKDGCFSCRDYEKVINGEATQVGIGNFNREIYSLEYTHAFTQSKEEVQIPK
jgi:CRISPR/Cas system-associated exonuclease Cas4 (RecB family)